MLESRDKRKRDKGIVLGSLQVFGLNFVMLGKILKNPLDCLRNLSPLRKGIIILRAIEQQSEAWLQKGFAFC